MRNVLIKKSFEKTVSRKTLSTISTAVVLSLLLPCSINALADSQSMPAEKPQRIAAPSGLQYEDLRTGDGEIADVGSRVKVHYTGWLQQADGSAGAKFDASRDHGKPFEFTVGKGRVIKGWDAGVRGMRTGGIRRLYIPASLGYGARGAGRLIPPNSPLIFEIELLETN
jgi:FKBP-type peptidyl-prolyl cis-trans isomerase FkpA